MKFIFSILFLMVLFSCKEEINKEDNKKKAKTILLPIPYGFFGRRTTFSRAEIENSILGVYSSRNGGSYISLFKDSFYEYRNMSCTSGQLDSGYYSLHNDRMIFKTLIKTTERNNDVFMQDPHFKNAVLKNHKIIFSSKKRAYPKILFKLEIGHENFEELNKKGNGETFKLDTLNRIIEEGKYENFKLLNGWKKNYQNSKNDIGTTTYYKNGKIDTSRN